MKDLLLRSSLVIITIICCVLLFAPNYLEQELQIVFKREQRLPSGEKAIIGREVVENFIRDKSKGPSLFFPGSECQIIEPDGAKKPYTCLLRGRFITAARINELSQANSEIINELRTGLLPHPIERLFGSRAKDGVKNLKVKLGLDLQGGMRATFQADYETYLKKLTEKFGPRVAELQEKVKSEKNPDKLSELNRELSDLQDMLELSDVRKIELLHDSQRVISRRLDNMKLSEPEVRVQEGSFSIGVDMPGVTNSSGVLRQLRDTVSVEYRIVNGAASDRINREFSEEIREIGDHYRRGKVDPQDIKYIMDDVAKRSGLTAEEGRLFLLWRRGVSKSSPVLPREFRVLGPPVLDGDDMTNAQYSVNPNSGYYQINFELSSAGAALFGQVTRENVGNQLAILWGDRVVSDPNIREPITGGVGRIDGDFDKEQAERVSAVIREGALPLPLELISVSFIGPSLGQDSIEAGITSIGIGFMLVMIFMLFYYKFMGMVANIALLLNLVIIAGILSLLEFTLTLPGFAGIILTVGMAVDASVIIFEKIKEEVREGKGPTVAVDSGFHSSFWTILDANVTTLIAAVILWKVGDQFGDSAIKGFSITLFFGLLSSMFTALYVSRLVIDFKLYLLRPEKLSIGYRLYKKEAL